MRNKYLLSLLAALGFSGCGNNNEIWDEPCLLWSRSRLDS